MKDFPDFMKAGANHIDPGEQNTADIDGYFYEAADGSQMAFWTCYSDRKSKKHTHDFDEYVLGPGDELFIPKGTEQWGRSIAGTRTIHAFGGRRISGQGRKGEQGTG